MDAQTARAAPPQPVAETAFEKRRGISNVEVRSGFAQVHVSHLSAPLTDSRLRVLEAVGEAGISIDFLKLTQTGLSFVVAAEMAEDVAKTIGALDVRCTVREGRHILLVHAVNMRDEEGLIARIILEAIASGVRIDHVSDMHDRVLIVVGAEDADRLKTRIEDNLVGASFAP